MKMKIFKKIEESLYFGKIIKKYGTRIRFGRTNWTDQVTINLSYPFFLRTLHWEKNQKIKCSVKTMGLSDD